MQDRPSPERNSKRKPTSHTPTQWVLGEGTLGGRGLYSPARPQAWDDKCTWGGLQRLHFVVHPCLAE